MLSTLGNEGGTPEIIPLSFHVDYWNDIGWKDRFSSPEWSARQRSYASVTPSNRTYTPQLVVQGQIDCVGSNEPCIRRAVDRIASQPTKGDIVIEEVRNTGGHVGVRANATLEAGQPGVIAYVVIYETGLSTDVKRGENRGRELRNDFVVRHLEKVGTVPPRDTASRSVSARVPIDSAWNAGRLGAVVFVQDPSSRRVLAVARAPIGYETTALKPLP